jgi:hypothetical protein
MRSRLFSTILLAALAVYAVSCGHYVQATPGTHTVRLYPDEATFEKVNSLKHEGGPMGMIGGLGENFLAKELDDHTPVRIISQDSQGAQIEVLDGPHKGEQGFVAKENLS